MVGTLLDTKMWVGQSRKMSIELLGIALIIFLVMAILHTPRTATILHQIGVPVGFGSTGFIIPLMVLPATISAYLRGGIIVSLINAAAPVFGTNIPLAATSYYPPDWINFFLFYILFILIIGLCGYILGITARRATYHYIR